MLHRLSKLSLLLLPIFLISCTWVLLSNRFALGDDWTYFGKYSGEYDKVCRNYRNPHPQFFGPGKTTYKNGLHASRTCMSYQEYLCRINITCKQHSDVPEPGQKYSEREKCEWDAGSYWLPDWVNAHGNMEKKAKISKEVCEAEISKCNSAPKGDHSCLR